MTGMGGRRSTTGAPRPGDARRAVPPRPRYPRIAAAGGSLLVTLWPCSAAVGLLPIESMAAPAVSTQAPAGPAQGALRLAGSVTARCRATRSGQRPRPRRRRNRPCRRRPRRRSRPAPAAAAGGLRPVAQRVWLVPPRRHGTPHLPGLRQPDRQPARRALQVESRQPHAFGIDDSGTMDYFVVFTHGVNAAIGFHDIPVKDGHRCRPGPSSARRSRTAACASGAPTRRRCGASRRSAPGRRAA